LCAGFEECEATEMKMTKNVSDEQCKTERPKAKMKKHQHKKLFFNFF